jgi:hypothetical protein
MQIKTNFNLFISYSKLDKDLVVQLTNDLIKNGIKVFYDENIIEDGKDWQKQLTDALINADGILVLITPNSISSKYVMNELGMARAYYLDEKRGKLLLPLIYGNVEIPTFIQDIQAIIWNKNYNEVIDRITEAVYNYDRKKKRTTDIKNEKNEFEGDILKKSSKRNYWLLILNPKTWEIEQLNEGDNTFFSTYHFGEKRPEYNLIKKVRKGDHVLGFASGDYQSVVCLMEVVEPVGADIGQGEIFKMNVKSVLNPRIPLHNFQDKIPNILPRLRQNKKPPELFYSLTADIYKSILTSSNQLGKVDVKSYQPFFLTEGNHRGTEDQLDFENDINSFASVIAFEKVNPPLAIGLFGNWGSGKSFFMEKLSDRIEEICESKEPEYIQNVVQVKFNSWHYSDANLWASLITQIFESLHDYATNKRFGAEAIKAIYKDLNITSHQLEETQKKLDSNTIEANALKDQKENVEEIIKQKKETLKIWNAKDLAKIVLSDSYIQKDFENIKLQFIDENLIDNIDQIDEKLSKINTVRGQVIESLVLLKDHRRGNWKWVWILALLFALLVFLALGPLKHTIQEFIQVGYIVTGLFLTWLTNLIAKLTPYFNKVNAFFKRLKSLKETIEKEKEKVRLKEHDEVDRLNKDINRLVAENADLELKQKQVEEKRRLLQKELEDIGSGRLLASFLASRSTDDAYVKQLGIISWIRKDFSKLNELFKKQKTIQERETDLKTEIQIDRIVLYIDDLDRCNEDIVVKVLEAIHLLLAFPLFVVVVGVDPRWLNNALSEKYKNLFGHINENDQRANRNELSEKKISSDEILLNAEIATSYDYLEKIFQIPFALKPINKEGRDKLINYLIKDEMLNDMVSATIQEGAQLSDNSDAEIKAADMPSSSVPYNEEKVIIISKEEKLTKIKKTKERLVFTTLERDYMQRISSLFGKTPRSINRYINIYRIIKAHGNLKITGDFSQEEFKPIMFLLGVIVGYSPYAKDFIDEILISNNSQKFGDFFEKSRLNRDFKTLLEPFIAEIDELIMVNFKNNLELISRFSFRTILTEI